MTGENLLPDLADILLQWRRHRYVLATDVEKMYRQIGVHPQDRDLQRVERGCQEIKVYRLNTVTYGLTCAPFLAIRTLRQLAEDEGQTFPLGAAVLRQDVHMEDVLTGASSLAEARELRAQLSQICRAGGFPLKKWSANEESLLKELPTEDLLLKESWQPGESHSTFELRWLPCDDSFTFSAPQWTLERVSKREVLSCH